MGEQEDVRAIASIMNDTSPFPVEIDVQNAWLIVAAMQLVITHPGLSGQTRRMYESIGRQFQMRLVEQHPEIAEIVEKGWHREFDVDENGRQVQ